MDDLINDVTTCLESLYSSQILEQREDFISKIVEMTYKVLKENGELRVK